VIWVRFCKQTLTGHDKWVRRIAVNGDGSLLASASSDHTARVWDLRTNKCTLTFRDHGNVVEDVTFSNKEADKTLFKLVNAVRRFGQDSSSADC